MHRGYVKLWRKTFDAGLHRDHKLFTLWVWLLANVTHQPLRYLAGDRMLTLLPGQRVVARRALAEELGLSEKEVRTRLRKLERLGCVRLSRVGRLTLLGVTNWDRYQTGPGASIAPVEAGPAAPDDGAGEAAAPLSRPIPGPASGPVPGRAGGRVRAAKQTQDHTSTAQERHCAAGAAPRAAANGAEASGAPGNVPSEPARGYEYGRGKRLTGRRLHWFERFWEAFADKRGKAGAARAFAALGLGGGRPGDGLPERIERAAAEYARRRPALVAAGSTPKMAQGWLADRRWEDELADPRDELRAWAEGPDADLCPAAAVRIEPDADPSAPARHGRGPRLPPLSVPPSGPQPNAASPAASPGARSGLPPTAGAARRALGLAKQHPRTAEPDAFPPRAAHAAGGAFPRTGGGAR